MPQLFRAPFADRTDNWSLLRASPDFHVGNDLVPFDTQDIPNASKASMSLLDPSFVAIQ